MRSLPVLLLTAAALASAQQIGQNKPADAQPGFTLTVQVATGG